MKRLFYSAIILLMLCSCQRSGKAVGVIAGSLASGFGEFLGKSGGEAIARSFSQQDVSKQQALWQVASQLNKSMPIQIDQETILSNIGVQGDGLVYNHQLVNYLSTEVSPNELVDALYPGIKNSVCSSPDMQPALKKQISFHYSYFGNDRKFIAKFVVTPSDCGC